MCDLYQPCKTMLSIGFATARTYLLDFALPVFFRIRLFHFKLISFDEGLDFEEGDLHFCILKKYNFSQLLPIILYSLYIFTRYYLFFIFKHSVNFVHVFQFFSIDFSHETYGLSISDSFLFRRFGHNLNKSKRV